MKRKSISIAAAAAAIFASLALFLHTFSASPLPMIALKERLPELIIVPAHDMRAFAEMTTLSQAGSKTAAEDGIFRP